ncbi:NAD(P)-binding protein-3 [Coleophoma cylindrospora]|uniref:NAD(P)-binding protein-3 n=1 Tax=Coleophoma cylindrospora TaxID=1849047 RepID=A0A3D8QKV0_9HELO|nr:NAD(P)-binding protein-3 [Coleophoma cylindrospora]
MTTNTSVSHPTLDFKGLHFDHIESATITNSSILSLSKNLPEPITNIETVALVVDKPKADFKLETVFLDEVRGDELLIDMKYSGICHTDIVLQQGLLPMVEFPAIFGHEGSGFILSIGKDVKNKDLKVGDAVLLSFNTCGNCKPCVTGHPAYCHIHPEVNHNAVRLGDRSTPGKLHDGRSVRSQYFGQSSFAKKSIVNEKCVVKCAYPEQLDIYAPMGCGFQTGAGTVLNVLKPTKEDSIVVFGLGSVGLTCLMAAHYIGAGQIIAIDIVEEKLQIAKELGATHLINSKDVPDVVAEIKKITNGGATQAVDCTGLLSVIESMIESIGPMGVAATVGVPPAGAKISIDPLTFLLQNKKYIGVIEGDSNPVDFIPQLIEMHQKGKFPIERLCKTYLVENLQDAIHDMHAGKVIKPIISWG